MTTWIEGLITKNAELEARLPAALVAAAKA